jgi:hypothetical protein
MYIKQIAFISDIHAGSTKAILPPNFQTLEGQPIGQSSLQRWLWEGWTAGRQWLQAKAGPDPLAKVLNGDVTEGNHHGTKEIWSPEVGDHSKAAVETLEPLVDDTPGPVFMVRGTECHTASHEISVGRRLGCELNPEHGEPYWDRLTLDICGKRISVRHHFPATSRVHLEASQYSIQFGNAVLEANRMGERTPDIIVGAHRHRPGHWSDGHGMTIVTGAWQVLTRHGYKVVPDGRPNPRIYHLDFRNVEPGALPFISWFTVKAPEPPAVSL